MLENAQKKIQIVYIVSQKELDEVQDIMKNLHHSIKEYIAIDKIFIGFSHETAMKKMDICNVGVFRENILLKSANKRYAELEVLQNDVSNDECIKIVEEANRINKAIEIFEEIEKIFIESNLADTVIIKSVDL
jgi:hypothetical protein